MSSCDNKEFNLIDMTEQDQINLLEKAWNQGWMHRERYDEIEHPKGMDYEEINFYHFEKWLAKNKQLLIHSVVVNEANWCNNCQKPIRMVNNTLQLLCECDVSEVAFNCFGGNHAKGIKPCVEHCGEDICLKPNN